MSRSEAPLAAPAPATAGPTSATRYAAAHALQYSRHDPLAALSAYDALIARDPESVEASYATAQVFGLANQVVPVDRRLAAMRSLIRRQLTRDRAAVRAGTGS